MRRLLDCFIIIAVVLFGFAATVSAGVPVSQVVSGGTGWGALQSGAVLYGNGTSPIATTTAGLPGQVLALLNGIPKWTATTTFSTGLLYSNGTVTLDATGNWTGSLNGYTAAQLIAGGFSTTSADYWKGTRTFFATTSNDYWKTQRDFFSTSTTAYNLAQQNLFSTTSNDYWESQRSFFSTTSATFFLSSQTLFSTTSADYWATQRNFFSTTSAQYFLAQNQGAAFSTTSATYFADASTTIPKTYKANTYTTALQTIPYASTTALTAAYASSTEWWGGGLASTCNSGNVLTWGSGRFGCAADQTSAGGSTFSTTSNDYWQTQRSFFSTTSSDFFLSQRNLFSTTSTNYWKSVTDLFSTTSAQYLLSVSSLFSTTSTDYWQSQRNFFSTSSASYFLAQNQGASFSTTSAIFFANASTTIPKTYTANTFTAQQTFAYASSTGLSTAYASTSLLYVNGLGGCTAGQYLTWSAGSFSCATDQTSAGGSTFSTTSNDYWQSQRSFFSTTSDDFFISQRSFFSTTSTNYWKSVTDLFSTTSATFFLSTNTLFSTTSADYLATQRNFFSTTSANYWETQQAPRGGSGAAFPFTAVPTYGTTPANSTSTLIGFTNGLYTAASSTIGGDLTIQGNATTTGIFSAASDSFRINSLGRITKLDNTSISIGAANLQMSASGADLLFQNNTNTLGSAIKLQAGGSSLNRDGTSAIKHFVGTLERLRTTGYGFTGIASTSPFALLSIEATSTSLATSTILFAVGSSTAAGVESTIFSIDNTGAASTTLLYGAQLRTCNSGNVLTWAAGQFGCAADQTGSAGSFSTTSEDYWKTQRDFFSTTSANYWSSGLTFFSTTSADYWQGQRSFFSTTSNAFFLSQQNLFSTTSTNYWKSVTDLFSTTSAQYFAHSSTTIPKTYTANSFTGLQTFNSASTTALSTNNLSIANALTFGGVTGSAWSSFCTAITGSASLCDGNDATGGGSGGSGTVATSSNEVANQIAVFSSNSATPALISGSAGLTFNGNMFAAGEGNTVSGDAAVALGEGNVASGVYSGAWGLNNQATGNFAFAIGHDASSTGAWGTSIGDNTLASGQFSIAMGATSTASGSYALAVGQRANAVTTGAIAIGADATAGALAGSDYPIAIGNQSTASKIGTVAIGLGAGATGAYSLAIGNTALATQGEGIAFGEYAFSQGSAAMALGNYTNQTGNKGITLGTGINAGSQLTNSTGGIYMGTNSTVPTLIITTSAGAGTIGTVGIGTVSPSSLLDVQGLVNAQYFTATSTANKSTFPYASTTAITSTNASTSNLTISGIAVGSTRCLNIGSTGTVGVAAADCGTGVGSAATDFFFINNGGTTTAATTTSIWTKGVFFASSTKAASQLPYASTTAISATIASTTNLYVSSAPNALALMGVNGLLGKFAGSAPCTNQVALSISALGVIGCTSVTNAMLSNSAVTINTTGIATGGGSVSLGASLTVNASSSPTLGYFLATSTASTSSVAGVMTVGTTTQMKASLAALTVSNALNALGGLVVATWTNVTNALSVLNAAGTTVFNVDTTSSNTWFGVGTTTPWTPNTTVVATFDNTPLGTGATASTTVMFGDGGTTTSRFQIDTVNATGTPICVYFAGTTLTAQFGHCN